MYQGNHNRVNVDIGGSKTIYNIIGSSGAANVSIKIYGTSVDSEYLSTTLTGLDTNPNLTSLLINTYQANASATTLLSLDQVSMFKYVIILISYINGSWLTLNLSFSTGGYTTTNLVNSTTNPTTYGYIIDSDPTSGYPRIQNKTGSVLSGTINNFFHLCSMRCIGVCISLFVAKILLY